MAMRVRTLSYASERFSEAPATIWVLLEEVLERMGMKMLNRQDPGTRQVVVRPTGTRLAAIPSSRLSLPPRLGKLGYHWSVLSRKISNQRTGLMAWTTAAISCRLRSWRRYVVVASPIQITRPALAMYGTGRKRVQIRHDIERACRSAGWQCGSDVETLPMVAMSAANPLSPAADGCLRREARNASATLHGMIDTAKNP